MTLGARKPKKKPVLVLDPEEAAKAGEEMEKAVAQMMGGTDSPPPPREARAAGLDPMGTGHHDLEDDNETFEEPADYPEADFDEIDDEDFTETEDSGLSLAPGHATPPPEPDPFEDEDDDVLAYWSNPDRGDAAPEEEEWAEQAPVDAEPVDPATVGDEADWSEPSPREQPRSVSEEPVLDASEEPLAESEPTEEAWQVEAPVADAIPSSHGRQPVNLSEENPAAEPDPVQAADEDAASEAAESRVHEAEPDQPVAPDSGPAQPRPAEPVERAHCEVRKRLSSTDSTYAPRLRDRIKQVLLWLWRFLTG